MQEIDGEACSAGRRGGSAWMAAALEPRFKSNAADTVGDRVSRSPAF